MREIPGAPKAEGHIGLYGVRWWIGCETETCLPRNAGRAATTAEVLVAARKQVQAGQRVARFWHAWKIRPDASAFARKRSRQPSAWTR